MKVFKINMVALALLILAATGCSKKFEEYSLNKNLPQAVPPGVLLRGALNSIVTFPGGFEDKAGQFYASNYTYYGDNKFWTGSADLRYGVLNDVLNMEKQAYNATGTSNNPYHALGLFLRAFQFVEMSEKVGDIPVSEALQGTGNVKPKYDSQKQVFLLSLNELDSANTILSGLLSNGFLEFSGDFYFKEALSGKYAGGNGRDALVQWQKVVNSYALRVLIELSKKDGDADLAVKAKFAAIFNNPAKYPIFTSNDDNLQYVYNATYNYHPNNITNYGNDAGRLNVGGTLLNNLSALNDIRAMYLAEPARGLGFTDTDYRSFKGADLGQDLSNMAALSAQGKLSFLNYNRYYSGYTGEPTFIISYPEVCFAVAEAANRGWVSASAEAWYQKGTKAMFAFYGIVDGDNTVTFRKSDGSGNNVYTVPFSFSTYFNQPSVKYKGDNADGLKQILLQKYLAYARNSGLQAYYQWRRTGVPAFNTGPGTGNGGVIPLRFQYPSNERSVNKDNNDAAVTSQFGGAGDDINQLLWINK
jgi:hypothetical protein